MCTGLRHVTNELLYRYCRGCSRLIRENWVIVRLAIAGGYFKHPSRILNSLYRPEHWKAYQVLYLLH